MFILEFLSYMSVDYTRNRQWTINPKGSRYKKTYIFSTQHLAEKLRERNTTKMIGRNIIQISLQT
jgi:hypothetical protein